MTTPSSNNSSIIINDFSQSPTREQFIKHVTALVEARRANVKYESALIAALATGPKTTIELASHLKVRRDVVLNTLYNLQRRRIVYEFGRINPERKTGRPVIVWGLT